MADNVQMVVKGSVLTITVDLSKDYGPSKSGKTTTIASTRGSVPLKDAGGVKVNVNVYK